MSWCCHRTFDLNASLFATVMVKCPASFIESYLALCKAPIDHDHGVYLVGTCHDPNDGISGYKAIKNLEELAKISPVDSLRKQQILKRNMIFKTTEALTAQCNQDIYCAAILRVIRELQD